MIFFFFFFFLNTRRGLAIPANIKETEELYSTEMFKVRSKIKYLSYAALLKCWNFKNWSR